MDRNFYRCLVAVSAMWLAVGVTVYFQQSVTLRKVVKVPVGETAPSPMTVAERVLVPTAVLLAIALVIRSTISTPFPFMAVAGNCTAWCIFLTKYAYYVFGLLLVLLPVSVVLLMMRYLQESSDQIFSDYLRRGQK